MHAYTHWQINKATAEEMLDELGIDQGNGDDIGIDFPSWQQVCMFMCMYVGRYVCR